MTKVMALKEPGENYHMNILWDGNSSSYTCFTANGVFRAVGIKFQYFSFPSFLNGSPANAEKMTKLRFISRACKGGSPCLNHDSVFLLPKDIIEISAPLQQFLHLFL